jgi:AcrR family transcriptional regulator
MRAMGASATGPKWGKRALAGGVKDPIAGRGDQGKNGGKSDDKDLLDAALAIMAEEGFGGLTLRPLAKRLGYPIATFARQVGSKDELLDYLIALAARADEEDLAPWLRLVESFESIPRDALIEITEEVLRMRCGSGGPRSHFKCELIQAAASNPRLRAALAQWIAVDHQLWRAMVERAENVPTSFDMAAALAAFAIDDVARALIIDDFDTYRWMRREGIRRLWHGLFLGQPMPPSILYERAISDQPSPNGTPLWTAKTLTTGRDQNFGAIIAGIILDTGTDSVTHREVARRADMPHSSVAYHYPMQDDLVELGMNAIVEMVRSESLAAMDSKELPIVAGQLAYASFAIALAAARRPNLRPIAREMRRRRGENLMPWLQQNSPVGARVEVADVQAMSSVLIGAILLSRAGVRNSAPLTTQLFGQLGDWPDLLVRFS